MKKIKNKPGKRLEKKNDEGVVVNLGSEARKGISPQETEQSTTTYEAYTTSTSESEPVRKGNSLKKNAKRNSTQRDKVYTATDPEICFTIPEGGRGNVRIVGFNNPGPIKSPSKQVDFALLDAVYGSSPEVSSDDDVDNAQLNIKHTDVYRVENQGNQLFVKGSNDNHGPSDNEEKPTATGQDNVQERNKSNKNNETGVQPSLALPLFSVNIRTSHEEVNHCAPNGQHEASVRKPSSQLSKLKRHIFETEKSDLINSEQKNDNLLENQNGAPLLHTLASNEQKKPLTRVKNSKNNSEYDVYYIDEKCTDTEELRDVLEKIMSISNQGNAFHNPNSGQTGVKIQSRMQQKGIEQKNECSETERSISDNGITRPLIYVAKIDSNTISVLEREHKTETEDENKEHILNITSKPSKRTLLSNKTLSKGLSKKNSESFGSKIGMKKSKRSFLKSSIPKVASLRSKKRSSVSINKKDNNFKGNISNTSNKYVIRDVIVIPDEQVSEQSLKIYPVKPLDYEIPEETVMLEEREIRLHGYETDRNVFSPSSKKDLGRKKIKRKTQENNSNSQNSSVPCLYSSSTSSVGGRESISKSNYVGNMIVESRNNQRITQDRSCTSKINNIQNIDEKDVELNYDEGASTIFIGSETHREILEAINASSSKGSIIKLPTTKLSRQGSTGKRLFLTSKTTKVTDPLRKPRSAVKTITEENAPVGKKGLLNNQNVKSVKQVPTDVTDTVGNVVTDKSEIRTKYDQVPGEPEPNKINPFTKENNKQSATNILAYPSRVDNNNPLKYIINKNNDKKNLKLKVDKSTNDIRKESKLMISKSFSEPIILEDSQNKPNIPGSAIVNSNENKVTENKVPSRKRRREKKSIPPESLVYLGAIPNTAYNVFFSPEQNTYKNDDKTDVKSVKSETKKLGPIRSKKLIEEGPKAILIFVNKKTELNRNPFDGNVVYGDGYDSKRHKDKNQKGKGKDRGKHGKDKGKSRGSDSDVSGRGKRGLGEGKDRGREFDVDSKIYGGPGSRYGGDKVVVERSPSGNKTTTKYPCGCMKITKYNPENETSSEEITSAFCQLGSKCDISQSQNNKRLMKYRYDSESFRESPYKSQRLPRSPQLDIVVEGIVSKKPIKPQPPAQKMNGTNLTGTLTIKTNRCNGVLNFYIDPRLKDYLCKNLPCAANNNDKYSSYSYR